MAELTNLRREYAKSVLDVQNVAPDPVVQFEKWFAEAQAAQVPDPNAMNVATVSKNGLPSSRIILLKGVENGYFIFFTNYQSNKGKDLEENPACALTFYWPELERQVRIDGVAERISEERSTTYFQSRPRASQVGAWASPQSLPIKNRSILEERIREIEKRFSGQEVLPKPKQWGGYQVLPYQIEFWQGRESRLHDRILYTRNEGTWQIDRLAP